MKFFKPGLVLLSIFTGVFLISNYYIETSSHSAEVYLNILATTGKKITIAVPEFLKSDDLSESSPVSRQISDIIINDLKFSGLFMIAETANFPPGTKLNDQESIKKTMADWALAGVQAAIEGSYSIKGSNLIIEAKLHDLTTNQLITGKRYSGNKNFIRYMAHQFSDEVVFQFTGERGVAHTKIAYVSNASGNKEIYIMDYDGYNPVRVTNNRSINLTPIWAPDGRAIAFTSYQMEYPFLYLLYIYEGRQVVISSFRGLNTTPAWSPDGKMVAYTLSKDGNPEIYVLKLASGELKRLTNNRFIDTSPSWSPTGREIVFTSDRSGTPQIWIMDAEGANVRRLSFEGSFNDQAKWSPKGDMIAYTSRQGGVFDIWVVNADGSNFRKLTTGYGSNESPSWAPNGRHIVFSSSRGGRAQLYTMFTDGTGQQRLTRDGGDATSPSWSP